MYALNIEILGFLVFLLNCKTFCGIFCRRWRKTWKVWEFLIFLLKKWFFSFFFACRSELRFIWFLFLFLIFFCFGSNALQCLRHWRKFWNVSEIEIFRKYLNFLFWTKNVQVFSKVSNIWLFTPCFRIQPNVHSNFSYHAIKNVEMFEKL